MGTGALRGREDGDIMLKTGVAACLSSGSCSIAYHDLGAEDADVFLYKCSLCMLALEGEPKLWCRDSKYS